jgi:hypothetical protein
MPDPDRLLATLSRSARAHRETPGRRGRLVELQDVDDVLVAGDLHGNLENFRRLLQRADLATHPRRHLVLQEIIHGAAEYVNGSDRSHQLFDVVAALKCQYPSRVHLLPGNHEVAQFTDRLVMKNDRPLNLLFYQGIETAYCDRAQEVYAAYGEVCMSLPLALRTPNRVFLSHSLPNARQLESFDLTILEREEVPESEWLPGGSFYALLWGRDVSQANAEAFLQKVDADLLISGHIPCDNGYNTPNDRQLILDSVSEPAAYCLFPTDRPLTHQQLTACVALL